MEVDPPQAAGLQEAEAGEAFDLEVRAVSRHRSERCWTAPLPHHCTCRRRRRSPPPRRRSPPPLLQAYAANYKDHARIDRLLFVAEKSAGRPLELQALKLAADALKQVGRGAPLWRHRPAAVPFSAVLVASAAPAARRAALLQTQNTQRYCEVVERIGGRAGPEYALDRCAPLFGSLCRACPAPCILLPCPRAPGPAAPLSLAWRWSSRCCAAAPEACGCAASPPADANPCFFLSSPAGTGWTAWSARRSRSRTSWSRVG